MAQQMQTRKTRQASPERWRKAAVRAIAEGVQVRQVNANGMWVATSGSDATMAYLIEVTNGVAQSCTCPAGEFGDPVCKHLARYYLDMGLLDPEPEPPAPAAEVVCFRCQGMLAGCPVCQGAGIASLAAQAATLCAAARDARCDHCGGPLDDDAETDEALQTLCGACGEASKEAALGISAIRREDSRRLTRAA